MYCSIEQCNQKHKAKGYCIKHYAKIIRYNKPITKKCSVKNCKNSHKAKGYCNMHYLRIIKYGSINLPKKENICSVLGCKKKYHGKGYCSIHLSRLNRNNTTDNLPKRKFSKLCSIHTCCKKHEGKGFCVKHLARFNKWGDPNFIGNIKGTKFTDEHKKKLSDIKLKYYEKGSRLLNLPFKDTKPERFMKSILNINGIKCKSDYLVKGRPDIFIEPNICIFIDGCYWHGCEKCGFINEKKKNYDSNITKILQKQNHIVLRFWEHEINNDLVGCYNKVKSLIHCKPEP